LYKLRLVFKKDEAAKYLGHLDILRTFIRALRRGGIPIKYTQGFNPHAILTFALPTGVGVTSECEIVDIVLKEQLPLREVSEKINLNMPPNSILITSAEYTNTPMPIIEKAEYTASVKTKSVVSNETIKNALTQKEITIEKKSKKRTVQINIMEHISEIEVLKNAQNIIKLRYIIPAGNTFNIRPQLVTEALFADFLGLEILCADYHRKRFLFAK